MQRAFLLTLGCLAGVAGSRGDARAAAPAAATEKPLASRGETARSTPSASATTDAADPGASRIREGSKVSNQIGEFQRSGDRVNFFPKEGKGAAIRVLENLALERISRSLEDDPSIRAWSVDGMITEFRGENYLLVTRAILKARVRADGPSAREVSELPAKAAAPKSPSLPPRTE